MSTLAERAKKLGLWDADLHQIFDRVEKLQELLAEAYADADEVLRPRILQLEGQVEPLSIGHARYEVARRMNPRQWAEAWNLNLTTGKPFDQIIDDLAPFMMQRLAGRITQEELK
jgi:hypothetical protein